MVYHTINPILSSDISVISFIRREFRDLRALYCRIQLSYEIIRILNIMYNFFSFSKLDTGFRTCGNGDKKNQLEIILEIVFRQKSKHPNEKQDSHC